MNFGGKTLEFPLIQGGMGVGISLGNLAGHVMKEGCMGVISAAHPGFKLPHFRTDSIKANCDAIIEEAKKARVIAKEKGMLAVNVMVASKDYAKYVKAALEAKVDAIISGAGLPLDLPAIAKGSKVLLAPIVSSGRAIRMILRVWDKRHEATPDFVVIEGADAGGHLGFKKEELQAHAQEGLDKIFLDVKEELKAYEEKYEKDIKVFVAGGVYDGKDIAHYLNLGVDGVQMGTRFIATNECDADLKFKEAIVASKKGDVRLVRSPAGLPGRAIVNPFIVKTEAIGNISMQSCLECMVPCNPKDTPYCMSEALIQSALGNVDNGLVFAGTNAYRVDKIVSVHELISELKEDCEKGVVK